MYKKKLINHAGFSRNLQLLVFHFSLEIRVKLSFIKYDGDDVLSSFKEIPVINLHSSAVTYSYMSYLSGSSLKFPLISSIDFFLESHNSSKLCLYTVSFFFSFSVSLIFFIICYFQQHDQQILDHQNQTV